MDAAFKEMLALRQSSDIYLAALKDSRPRHGQILEATGAFGNGLLPRIERLYKTSAELLYFSERMRLATLVADDHSCALFDFKHVRFEVPAGVRSSSSGLCK